MICAEKIATALFRGSTNTRLQDFIYVVALTETNSLSGNVLSSAVRAVADHGHVAFRPLTDILEGRAERRQSDWLAWRRRQLGEVNYPELFADVFEAFVAFADPVINESVNALTWSPQTRSWS